MRRIPFQYVLILFVVFWTTGCASLIAIKDPEIRGSLQALYESEDFFLFKERYLDEKNKLPQKDALYFEALLSSLMNRYVESNRAIDKLRNDYADTLETPLLVELYQKKLENCVKACDYAEAASLCALLLEKYDDYLDSDDRESIQNEIKIWRCLADIPAPSVEKHGDAVFALKRDRAQLQNITLTFPSGPIDFVLDTGASFSVLQKSVAKTLGLTILPATFYVGALTGAKVPSHIAVSDRIDLGAITLRNTVFIVFDDEAMSFPQFDYEIKGILGFPVIQALEEIRINHKESELRVPAIARKYRNVNLLYTGLTPLVMVAYNGDPLTFSLDTGANTTMLFSPFYQKYEKTVLNSSTKKTFQIGGAGGTISADGYEDIAVEFKIGEKSAQLKGINLILDAPDRPARKLYGNLGQDYISQFDEMILSTKYSSLTFR